MLAAQARTDYGVTGAGVSVGAMVQIIHDVAPGAKLYFATGFGRAAQFAANIRALAAAGG